MPKFFSDRNQNVDVAGIYERASRIDVVQILTEAEEPQSNTIRQVRWRNRFKAVTGRLPDTERKQVIPCAYCHRSVREPADIQINRFNVFCDDQCRNDYHDIDF